MKYSVITMRTKASNEFRAKRHDIGQDPLPGLNDDQMILQAVLTNGHTYKKIS